VETKSEVIRNDEVIVPPPTPAVANYPAAVAIGVLIVATCLLLIVINRFDRTSGILAISLIVVLSFMGLTVFCLFFSVPSDQVTSGVIGGLIAAFGAVIAHWIGKVDKRPPD
jgi:hypothetical protein